MADREEPRRESKCELQDAHTQEPRGEVVTELVHGDDRGEHDEEERQRERVVLEVLEEPAHHATAGIFASAARTTASMATISSSSGSFERPCRAPTSAP